MIDKMRCAILAEELRAQFNSGNLSPIDVFRLAQNVPRLSVVLYPLGKSISGLCIKHSEFSLIAINSEQTYGRQRFTLSHELFHLYYDQQSNTVICPSKTSIKNDIEREADSFASFLLLPRLALINEIRNKQLSPANALDDDFLRKIIEIEQRYEISRGALLVRLEDEKAISAEQNDWLKINIKKNARRLGFSTTLYSNRQGSGAKTTDGYYIDLVADLLAGNAISRGKAKELLADGFRDDIYVTELEGDEIFD